MRTVTNPVVTASVTGSCPVLTPVDAAVARTAGRWIVGARGALVAALGSTLCAGAAAAPERYSLDPAHTTVALLVEHVGFADTLGQFTEVSGSFLYDEDAGRLDELEVIVRTESFDSHHAARDRHVRDADFLDVETHPVMRYSASASFPPGTTEGTLDGELTLLGTTRPLSLDWTLNKAETYPFGHERYTLGVSARGIVTRSDHGMDYGVANGLVGDEVELIIEIEAIRQ